MDLNALRLFVAAVQAGSLSAAAVYTGVPLPTLSRRVRELEAELQVRLFERSTRGVRLTDVGARLYEQAAQSVESLADAERLIVSEQAQLRGRLRLSIPPSFEPWWALIAAFQRSHPQVQVDVFTTERRVDLVEDGVDVALRIGELQHDTMVGRRLLSYRHVLVASPELLALHGRLDKPEAILQLPCAVWRRAGQGATAWQLGEQSVSPDAVLSSNDYLHLRACALAGQVITELPPFLAREGLASGRLQAVLAKHPMPQTDVSLLYPSRRWVSSIVRAYIDFCEASAAAFCSGPHAKPGRTRPKRG